LPKPPTNGFIFWGNNFFTYFIRFAFTLPVFLKIYFFTAGKNYYGSVNKTPEIPTVFSIYFLENSYKGKERIVIQTILYPF
jgi:hypothetical protein